ncbi:phage tail fiber protein [uncultured Megasphaera sp.]|mgnify:CR=1 FL=1|uniref:phage tail fiber domain-containing protein n=1 Tax=uncultured Megasphaera sp. TaxID=165188 RepID=UPI0020590AEF|nr:phage tail fiber protein [uncultured Megasphaera sp.]DAF09457.1 MAG TPA: tail fiber protein [Bacteriophage sp.]
MANTTGFKARVEYEVTDGTQTTYTFPFSYLRKKFVMVSILHSDASETALEYGVDYTVNDLSVSLTTPAQVGEHIIIYRQTSTDKIVTWNDGSILLARDMNTEDAQMLHLQEEQQDYIMAHAISTKVTSDKEVLWDALNHRVINVSDPKDPQDAVTKNYMETVQSGFVVANTKILDEAKSTLESTKNVYTETNNAYEGTKKEKEEIKAHIDTAKAWAVSDTSPDNVTDSSSTTGKTQSARSWALDVKSKVDTLRPLLDVKDDIARISDFKYIARNTSYNSGLYLYSPSLGVGYIIYVLNAGTTSSEEPDWSSLASKVSGAMLDMGSDSSKLYEPDSWKDWGVSYVDGTATLLICRFDKMFSLLTRMYKRNYYMPGDFTKRMSFQGAGYITNSGTYLNFSISLAKPVHYSVTSVTVSSLTDLIIRGDSKYYVGTSSQGAFLNDGVITSAKATLTENWINILVILTPKTSIPTNISVGLVCDLRLRFV